MPTIDVAFPTVAPAGITVEGASKFYGAAAAVDKLDLTIAAGTTTAIIGPNGAGKTTLLKLIAGVERPTSGRVLLDGRVISGQGAARASHAGVGYAHQVPQPFSDLSVRDNVRVGAIEHRIADLEHWVDHVLELCGLSDRADRLAGALQVLELKRLELARAISTRPSLLLLDEVCAGMNGKDLDAVIELVELLRREGPTVIMVEHIEAAVSRLASRVIVLDWGKLIADGTPVEIAADAQVREVYMGGSHLSGAGPHTPDFDGGNGRALVLSDLRAGYGMMEALHGVSLELRPGKVTAILGANGAGKTSLANAVSGVVPLRGGSIVLDGVAMEKLPAYKRALAGLAVVPEGRRILATLTVRENLLLSAGLKAKKEEVMRRLETVLEVFPQLSALMSRRGGALSGGQQQMLAIGRALMSDPKYLICDEISLGLAPVAIDSLYEGLTKVVARNVGVGIIEQHVQRSLAIADIAIVIDRGTTTYYGDPRPLNSASELNRVYFGSAAQP